MQPNTALLSRRGLLKALSAAGAGLALDGLAAAQDAPRPAPVKLGIDNFAVRAMGWKAPALIDYAARLETDSLFITDLHAFEKTDDAHLVDLRKQAADRGLQIQLGSWSICPTSRTFRKDWGTAEEHLRLGLRMAKALGSAVFRVVLGAGEDRLSEGGIEARIQDTAKVCRACRSQALDSGVKIAIENHAGDLQSWELVTLIEEAGRDYVGANMDSGNAAWTLEDPMTSLEALGPFALTTSLRDSAVWESENGITVQWTAMGDGLTDWQAYFDRFRVLCPGVPVHVETISGFNREFPYLRPEFWKAYPRARAAELSRFVAMAKRGKPRSPWQPPAGADRKQAEQEYQRAEVERSIRFLKELGLGARR